MRKVEVFSEMGANEVRTFQTYSGDFDTLSLPPGTQMLLKPAWCHAIGQAKLVNKAV
jgi:hypothetical protein